jgi:hypothetical protein
MDKDPALMTLQEIYAEVHRTSLGGPSREWLLDLAKELLTRLKQAQETK